MPRADFLTGLVLLLVSAMLIGEGLTLPGAGGLIMKGGEPGRVPLFLGFVIAIMAVVLIVRAVSQDGHRFHGVTALYSENKRSLGRALAVAAGGTMYVGLLGHNFSGDDLDYAFLTFGFIFTFIVIAEWKLAPEIAGRRWKSLDRYAPATAARIAAIFSFVPPARAPFVWLVITAAFQAAILAFVVSYVFEKQFFVQLP